MAHLSPREFDGWWTDPLIETFATEERFSRSDLVNIMANQDGGAHVDPTLDRDYASLCSDSLGLSFSMGPPDDNPPPVKNNVAHASLRQVAFEVLLTLERAGVIQDPLGDFASPQFYTRIDG